MQPWESVDGCHRKNILNGITLWKVESKANLPLEHAVQTLLVLNGSGKLRVRDLVLIASPGILLVLPQSDDAVAMPSAGDPFLLLQIADIPRTAAQREESDPAALYGRPAGEYRRDAEQHPVPGAPTAAENADGTFQDREVTKVVVEPVAQSPTSAPAPPPEPSPPAQSDSSEDRISQASPSAAEEASLRRRLASGPVSGRARHPVSRATRG